MYYKEFLIPFLLIIFFTGCSAKNINFEEPATKRTEYTSADNLKLNAVVIQGNEIPLDCTELSLYTNETFEPVVYDDFIEINSPLSEEDIACLLKLKNLKKLSISGCGLTDISFLKDLTKLEILSLNENNISNISPLSELKSLKELNLSFNPLKNISDLAALENLKALDISYTEFTDTNQLPLKLMSLDISGNDIRDFSPLEAMSEMEKISLCKTNAENIDFLKEMKNLEVLLASQNIIDDIKVLSDKNKLKYVYLNDNLITDFSALYNLDNPSELSLDLSADEADYFSKLYPACKLV